MIPRCLAVLAAILVAGCEVRVPQPPKPTSPAAPVEERAAREAVPAVSAPPAEPACEPVYGWSTNDEAFLDDLAHREFNYFWKEVFPETGIAIDHTENRIGKVAATGFELAALCVGVQRGWITRDEGYERTLRILNAFWDDPADPADGFVEGQYGLYWHFVEGATGRRMPLDCVAMCDSADFIAGTVVAGEFFKNTPVETLARRIYNGVEWDKFVSLRPDGKPGLLSFGWVPLHVSENYYDTDGLLKMNMVGLSDNSLLIYALALGSDTHPIPQETWEQYVDTYAMGEYAGYSCVRAGALFCRQVPQAFIRFSRKRDRKVEYFLDTVNAILADRAFNVQENGYPDTAWGLTDCFGKESYGHSAPPGPINNDGTIGSTAFAGALPHVPKRSMDAMRYARNTFGDRIYGPYGFTSSFNLKNAFVSPLYVGIELGPIIMMTENVRSGLIWDLFMSAPCMSNFVRRAGMSGVIDDFELPPEAPAYAAWTVDGGRARIADTDPQHGLKCLEMAATGAAVTVTGTLPCNDLMKFHFGNALCLWVRDGNVSSCAARLDGAWVPLVPAGQAQGLGWTQLGFQMPPHSATSQVTGFRMMVDVSGPRPALDNLSLEARPDMEGPERILDLAASPGSVGSSVNLTWTVPGAGGDDGVEKYVVRIRERPPSSSPEQRVMELLPLEAAGGVERRMVLLRSGRSYSISMAALDSHGHLGPFSPEVVAASNPSALNRSAYDFEEGRLDRRIGWGYSNWVVRIDNGFAAGSGSPRCLRVDYDKGNPWQYMSFALDPQMVFLHRYVAIRVKGRLKILCKLWASDAVQEDMEPRVCNSDTTWTELKFDTWTANLRPADRRDVTQLFLFPAPGQNGARGTFYIDDIRYSDQ